jgi:hypothetical protein
MANNAVSTTRTGQVPTQPGGGLTCNSGGRPINGGGTDGMNWPAMIARCSSSWPLPALKASHALSGSEEDADRIGRELPRGKLISTLSSPAILFANHAAPCRQALGGMLLHPLGELRRAHQAGLHRDVSEVRGGDGLLVAICRRGETAEHGDDLYHDRRTPSLRWALAPLTL